MKRSLLAAALTVACLVSAACGRSDEVQAPVQKQRVGGVSGHELAAVQILRRGNGTEPETLDPHRAEGVTAANVLRDLFEGLVTEAA